MPSGLKKRNGKTEEERKREGIREGQTKRERVANDREEDATAVISISRQAAELTLCWLGRCVVVHGLAWETATRELKSSLQVK